MKLKQSVTYFVTDIDTFPITKTYNDTIADANVYLDLNVDTHFNTNTNTDPNTETNINTSIDSVTETETHTHTGSNVCKFSDIDTNYVIRSSISMFASQAYIVKRVIKIKRVVDKQHYQYLNHFKLKRGRKVLLVSV